MIFYVDNLEYCQYILFTSVRVSILRPPGCVLVAVRKDVCGKMMCIFLNKPFKKHKHQVSFRMSTRNNVNVYGLQVSECPVCGPRLGVGCGAGGRTYAAAGL